MHFLEAAGEQEDFGEREPRRRYERRSGRDNDTSDISAYPSPLLPTPRLQYHSSGNGSAASGRWR